MDPTERPAGGTDWIEDLVISNNSLETYNSWVKGEIPFLSDIVLEQLKKFEYYGVLSGYDENPEHLTEYNFWEGLDLISTNLDSAASPLMLHSPSFIASYADENLVYGSDFAFLNFLPRMKINHL